MKLLSHWRLSKCLTASGYQHCPVLSLQVKVLRVVYHTHSTGHYKPTVCREITAAEQSARPTQCLVMLVSAGFCC